MFGNDIEKINTLIIEAGRLSAAIQSNEIALERWRGIRESATKGKDLLTMDEDSKRQLVAFDEHIDSLVKAIETSEKGLQKINKEIRELVELEERAAA
jgi:hypothetical protein